MHIHDILEKIEENRKLLNIVYSTQDFECCKDGESIYIYIKTKDKKENKRKIEKIKKEFKATEVVYVDVGKDEYGTFYSLEFKPRKLLIYG